MIKTKEDFKNCYITQSFDGTGYMIGMNKESIQITSKNFQSIKAFLEGEKEGTRAWALLILDSSKMVVNKKLNIRLGIGGRKLLYYDNNNHWFVYQGELPEDGWEIYKEKEEPKKTMTKEQAIKQNKSFKRYNGDEYYYGCASEGVCGYSKKGDCITNCINLLDIIIDPQEKVEIIEEK